MTPLEKIINRLNSGIELNENTINNKYLKDNIHKNRASHVLNILKSFKEEAESYLEQEKITIQKADKWDKLGEEIGKYCDDEPNNDLPDSEFGGSDGSLLDIGETAAIAFGYL